MEKLSLTFAAKWFNKFFECFVVYIFLRDLAYTYLPLDTFIFNSGIIYFETLFTEWNFPVFLMVVIFSLWWNEKEKKEKINSAALHDWMRSIMCYYAAFLLFQYGFAKLYNDQFHHTYYRDDSLAGNLTGFAVAWHFFNYSFYFTFLIGVLQVAGGIMLLFFKTSLAAALMLFPVMVNIALINLFYVISPSAFINAILILVAIFYIIWLKRKKLISFLFEKQSNLLSKKRNYYIKAALRILVVIFSFTIGYPYKKSDDVQFYAGKWKIVQLIRNKKIVDQLEWQNDPTAWNNVYIEEIGELAFSANPNYYDYSKNRVVNYYYKVVGNKMFLTRHSKNIGSDSDTVIIHRYNTNKLLWNTILHSDTLQMELQRDTMKNIINGEDLR